MGKWTMQWHHDRREILKRKWSSRGKQAARLASETRTWGREREPIRERDSQDLNPNDDLVLTACTPNGCIAYVNLAVEDRAWLREHLRAAAGEWQLVLRVYHAISTGQGRPEEHLVYDQPVGTDAERKHLPLSAPGWSYFVRLGLRSRSGVFVSLLTSNSVSGPEAAPAETPPVYAAAYALEPPGSVTGLEPAAAGTTRIAQGGPA